MSQTQTRSDHADLYFVLALIAFIPLGIFVPWAALVVAGYAYATPIRRHRRMLIAIWVIGALITAYFLLIAVGLLFPSSTLQVGPVHHVG
jgi:hypothetical protein